MIAYNPIILLQPADGETLTIWSVGSIIVTTFIGIFALAVSLGNFYVTRLTVIERIFFFGGALCLIKPGLLTDLIGISIVGAFLAIHIIRSKKHLSLSAEVKL